MKSYPAQISINQLSELTGRDRRTIKDRLASLTPLEERADGAHLYDIRAAIRAIFDFNPDDENQKVDFSAGDFQPQHEKAKLDFVKRQAMELELEEKKRNLIPKDEIRSGLQEIFASVRAKLLSIPTRAAQQIVGPPQKQTEALLKRLVEETLVELAEGKFDEPAS